MNPSQDAVSRLIDFIENQYLEIAVLRDELRTRDQSEINQLIERAKSSPVLKEHIRVLLNPVRAAIRKEIGLEEALKEAAKEVSAKMKLDS